MIELDGSEGGGQILRTALGLSALTKKAFRIKNIRKTRPKSGLAAQHLTCVNIIAEMCNAHVEGNRLGSENLEFIPRDLITKKIDVDIGTAGSTTLILQSVLIPYLFAKKAVTINITGGTDVKWSPPADYYRMVVLPYLRQFGSIEMNVIKRGYFPKGGGKIEVKIKPLFGIENGFDVFHKSLLDKKIGFFLDLQGKIEIIRGISYASKDLSDANVGERAFHGARSILNKNNCDISIQTEYSDSKCTGCGIVLWAIFTGDDSQHFIGCDSLGEKGKKAEQVGIDAAKSLIEEIDSGAAVDSHCADNLIPYLGLFGGNITTSRITNHIRTNIKVCEMFLGGKYEIEKLKVSYSQ